MVFSKVEVNLRRLLQEAPWQQNQAKLAHYISTARELLEQLGAEITTEGVPRVSKAKLSEYSEKIDALAATFAAPVTENQNPVDEIKEESSCEREKAESPISLPAGLRRRSTAQVEAGISSHDSKERDTGAPIKLDAEAQANIKKNRDLQDSLIDEMVDLARQLKESVDTRTRHRVPSTPGVMHRSSRRRRTFRQRDTQDSRRTLLQTRNPARPGGTPSGSAAAMGCSRSIRSPLEPRDSQLSNTKNSEERERKTMER